MRARPSMRAVVAGASLWLAGLAVAGATSSPVQLLEVRPGREAGHPAVLLEASAPVAYTSAQPDPFTVVLDLRHARAEGAVNRFTPTAGDPVTVVSRRADRGGRRCGRGSRQARPGRACPGPRPQRAEHHPGGVPRAERRPGAGGPAARGRGPRGAGHRAGVGRHRTAPGAVDRPPPRQRPARTQGAGGCRPAAAHRRGPGGRAAEGGRRARRGPP